jgi:outer membrane lipoprotein-sorting protein
VLLLTLLTCSSLLFVVPAAGADSSTDSLLRQVRAATRATRTLTADVLITTEGEGQQVTFTATLKLKKPNQVSIEVTGRLLDETDVSDCRTIWSWRSSPSTTATRKRSSRNTWRGTSCRS